MDYTHSTGGSSLPAMLVFLLLAGALVLSYMLIRAQLRTASGIEQLVRLGERQERELLRVGHTLDALASRVGTRHQLEALVAFAEAEFCRSRGAEEAIDDVLSARERSKRDVLVGE